MSSRAMTTTLSNAHLGRCHDNLHNNTAARLFPLALFPGKFSLLAIFPKKIPLLLPALLALPIIHQFLVVLVLQKQGIAVK